MSRASLARIAAVLLLVPLLAPSARTEEEEPTPLPDDRTGVRVSARADTDLYAETGRLVIWLSFRAEKPLPLRCQVLLHLADPKTGDVLVESNHVPLTPTTKWEPEQAVEYRLSNVVPGEEDGTRPALVVLVGLVDPTRENGWYGRLLLEGEEPFLDRRYLAARIERAKPTVRTVEGLLERASAEEAARRGAEAFHLREEAMFLATTIEQKVAVTAALLAQPPFTAEPVNVTEQIRIDRMVAAEKLRWLRDRASALVGRKEWRLALRVMERIGGVVEEERNTRVAGEVSSAKRAQKDIHDLRARLLALPQEERPDRRAIVDKAEGDAKKLLAAAQKQRKKGRQRLARALLQEILFDAGNPEAVKAPARRGVEEIETSLLHDLTPEEQKRLEAHSDHPAFHRLGTAVSGRFVFLGPEAMVRSIPVESRHRFDVASLLLTDLLGRAAVPPGQRVIVFFKETWDFGGATAGGSVINVGRAKADARGTRVDTGLYYHEFTHCVDDTRPVYHHKGGITEGIADTGAIFVHDMFSGARGRFERLSERPRQAFRRYYVRREEAYWRIPGYAPSAGLLLEILARHAPGPDGHADWTKLGVFFRAHRALFRPLKSWRTHRIVCHLGHAMEEAMGPEVWRTLEELRFPVDINSSREMATLFVSHGPELLNLFRGGRILGLLSLADRADPWFVSARARVTALALMDRIGQGRGERATATRQRLGIVDRFRVCGPFYGETGEGLAEVFPPELEFEPEKEYVSKGSVARWRVPASGAEHYAKMQGHGWIKLDYGYPDGAVTYALTHVTIPRDTQALAWIGRDDEVALWINGVFVERRRGRPRGPGHDQERWPIRLRAGRNRVFLKVRNHSGPTGFSLRLTRPDGKPLDGLEADLEPPGEGAPDKEARWQTVFEDTYRRRSLGRRYEVVAGEFRIQNKLLRGEAGKSRPGWRPFAVRPGFPQDYPAALLWLKPPVRDLPADFAWKIRLETARVPKIALTWDGEGDHETLSGWSLVLLPSKDGKRFTARLERYDLAHSVVARDVPVSWKAPEIVVRRIAGRVTVEIGGETVFAGISAPPLPPRRFGLAVWRRDPGIVGQSLSIPR